MKEKAFGILSGVIVLGGILAVVLFALFVR